MGDYMLKKLLISAAVVMAAAGLIAGCGSHSGTKADKNEITVGVTAGSSEEIMEVVAKSAEKQGLKVNVKTFGDYVSTDQALANGDIDLNAFQHKPYLDAFNEKNGTDLVPLEKTYLAPLAVYSKKYKDVKDIPDHADIAVPNDPTNEGRALLLLEKLGWIKIKEGVPSTKVTPQDIESFVKPIHIVELEAPPLPRSLDDTAASIINGGYAISAGLNSQKDSIFVEDNTSPYVNIIAVRKQDVDNPTYKKFAGIFRSDEVKNFINEKYKGAIVPTW